MGAAWGSPRFTKKEALKKLHGNLSAFGLYWDNKAKKDPHGHPNELDMRNWLEAYIEFLENHSRVFQNEQK